MILVFLPAYNEEAALTPLLEKFDVELKRTGEPWRIAVLDDGSSDNSVTLLNKLSARYPLTILRHEKNQGLGQTMIDGLEFVSSQTKPGDIVITMDCDDTHDPRYIHSAIAKLKEGFDVVILSRYQEGGGEKGLSAVKSLLSRGAGLFLKLFFPIRGVKEYSCGYRVMRADILHRAFDRFGKDFVRYPHMGFVVTPEILIKLRMLKARITEVPFVLRYDQKPTASKNRPLRTIRGYFALVWSYWGRA